MFQYCSFEFNILFGCYFQTDQVEEILAFYAFSCQNQLLLVELIQLATVLKTHSLVLHWRQKTLFHWMQMHYVAYCYYFIRCLVEDLSELHCVQLPTEFDFYRPSIRFVVVALNALEISKV